MFAGQRPPVATKFEHIRLIDNSPASVFSLMRGDRWTPADPWL